MTNIYKKSNKLGNPTFKVTSEDSMSKISFDSNGYIVKAYCGSIEEPTLVYSKEQDNKDCLKGAMYEMLVLSVQCFHEMFAEIKSPSQIACAKEVAAQRSGELTEKAHIALNEASELDSLL